MNRRLLQQMMSFLLVGGLSTLIDLVCVYIFNSLLGWHYLVAVTLAFLLATVFNYWASMRYTFQSKFSADQKHHEFILFLILSLMGWGLTLGLMWVTVDGWSWQVMPAKVAVTAIVMVFNFVTRKKLLEG